MAMAYFGDSLLPRTLGVAAMEVYLSGEMPYITAQDSSFMEPDSF